MTENICLNGHVMDNGKELCTRCNAPSATAPVAAVKTGKKSRKPAKAGAKPKSKSEAKRVKIQKGKK